MGYRTYGLHGFSGNMFDRTSWWPLIGLDYGIFADTLPTTTAKCGSAFRGVCDTAMLDLVPELLSGSKRFVYVLTLNTHLPLEEQPLPTDLSNLCKLRGVTDASCQLTGQLGGLFHHLNLILKRLPDHPLVMVVGDHSPPFSVQTSRAQYSSFNVPRYILEPR